MSDIPNERWEDALKYAKEMLEIYKSVPTGFFGATIIATYIDRYARGERTEDLLECLEGIE